MRKNPAGGFTLVELLVVISIIALLVSILMPSLSRAREQAKSAVCMSNLGQWGKLILMFTEENDGFFWPGNSPALMNTPDWWTGFWQVQLREYYSNGDMRVCPSANKPRYPVGQTISGAFILPGGTNLGWGAYPDGIPYAVEGDWGSYGMNGFVMHPKEGPDPVHNWTIDLSWHRIDQQKAYRIPMTLDQVWTEMWPADADTAQIPQEPPGPNNFLGTGEMSRATMLRHHDGINIVFMDLHVAHSNVKEELWGYKWHRQWETVNDKTMGYVVWPEWLDRF